MEDKISGWRGMLAAAGRTFTNLVRRTKVKTPRKKVALLREHRRTPGEYRPIFEFSLLVLTRHRRG